ncbi:MAG: anaerobic glycerol-3-phosphate dehydrogenase subunit GlpA [Desulfovibrionaceae bacterium]|nr:anaerobic glycerol-3-phosphate dehydrogenase subunit GlpA [Desulfovibrionaceae bacterium]
MKETTVVIIGGGATGAGLLRDLSMRGVPAVLFEKGGLCHGTSSRFHGLLHSGGRYAVSDNEAASECIRENAILRRIGAGCIHETEGFFVLTEEDDPSYVSSWVAGCSKAGIEAKELDPKEALLLEPGLSPSMKRVFQVPDAAVDGFRLVLHNAMSAERYGGTFYTYHEVLGILSENGRVTGVEVRNTHTGETMRIACKMVVNAAGSWSARVVKSSGIHLPLTPDKGTLIVFNRRITNHVVNRLHKSGDGDIFVPNGSVTILGTTSQTVDDPADFSTTTDEVLRLLDLGRPLFPAIDSYRILRVFAGTRPLYTPGPDAGRAASRGFHISDHAEDGLSGLLTIFGGKLTTYRLMAEKMADIVCAKLGVTAQCRTADEALVPEPEAWAQSSAKTIFLPQSIGLVADRLGDDFVSCVRNTECRGQKNPMVCECEMVSMAELLHVASQPSTHSLTDVRLRTRLGMGTCQGTFCGLRATSALVEHGIVFGNPLEDMRSFVTERWKGTRAAWWGQLAREMELARVMYSSVFDSRDDVPAVSSPDAVPEARKEQVSSAPVLSSNVSDTVVVGAGLSGSFAALLAAKAGKKVTLIAKGAGALAIGAATIDVLGCTGKGKVQGNPLDHLGDLGKTHPYNLTGRQTTEEALARFVEETGKRGWPMIGLDGSDLCNHLLPTVLGTEKISALYPASLDPAPLLAASKILVCGIEGLRDSMPGMAVHTLRNNPAFAGKKIAHCWLPTPWQGTYRVETALDVARALQSSICEDFMRALGKAAQGYDAVLLPAVCGIQPDLSIWSRLCAAAGCPVVEMTGLPPGVTGMRLGKLLQDALAGAGVTVLENTKVTGFEQEGGRMTALRTTHEDGERRYVADQFVIATGGIVSGGLEIHPGLAKDSVLGVTTALPGDTAKWALPDPLGPQAFALLGMPVLKTLEPTLDGQEPYLSNVRYIGRAIAGQDSAFERSGNGIAIATAYAAVMKPWL